MQSACWATAIRLKNVLPKHSAASYMSLRVAVVQENIYKLIFTGLHITGSRINTADNRPCPLTRIMKSKLILTTTRKLSGGDVFLADQVRRALMQLTPTQRQVIVLKFLEGWSNAEIAKTMKRPVGAVKSLQHRALAALNRLLTAYYK